MKVGSLAEIAIDPDAPAVCLDDLLDDRKAALIDDSSWWLDRRGPIEPDRGPTCQ
jgi:hypothetical protein